MMGEKAGTDQLHTRKLSSTSSDVLRTGEVLLPRQEQVRSC